MADEPLDPYMQRACIHDLLDELNGCVEDCLNKRDYDRYLRLMSRAERLAGAAADYGYDLMRPLAERLATVLHLLNRGKRRFLIRKYLTNPDSVNLDELDEALDLYPMDSAEHREDIERVERKMKGRSF